MYINKKEEQKRIEELKGLRKVNDELEKQLIEKSDGDIMLRAKNLSSELSKTKAKVSSLQLRLDSCIGVKHSAQIDLANLTFEVELYNELGFFGKLKLAFSSTSFFQIIS